MTNTFYKYCQLFIVLVFALVFIRCTDNNPSETESYQTGLWNNYIEYTWTHDGHPYSSQNFWIYSDDATTVLKQQFAGIAEEKFANVIQRFNFTNTQDFIYPASNDKLEIYVNRFNDNDICMAYFGGIIISSEPAYLEGAWLRYIKLTFLHELVHSFEFLIEGQTHLGTDVWFREGIACYIAGVEVFPNGMIDTEEELDYWIGLNENEINRGNPIYIHRWNDFPQNADYNFYYVMFELALRYILSEKGLGKSLDDVLNIFYDMKNGIYFHHSFENNFGIGLYEFRDEFYARIREYLGNVTININL